MCKSEKKSCDICISPLNSMSINHDHRTTLINLWPNFNAYFYEKGKDIKTNKKVNLYNLFVPRNRCNIVIFGAKHQPINDQSKM